MIDNNEHDTTVLTPKKLVSILLITFGIIILFSLFTEALPRLVVMFVGEVLIIVPAFIYLLKNKIRWVEAFRLHRTRGQMLFSAVLFFIPLYVLTDELDRFIINLFPMPDQFWDVLRDMVAFRSPLQTFFLILTGVVVAALVEEMLFRGLVQRSLEHYRDPATAIVLSAVLFAIVHFNPWTAIQITGLGLALGYVTWKSGSILPAIVIHGLNNLVSMLMMNASEEQLSWYLGDVHVKLPWILLALFLFLPALLYFRKSCV